MKTFLRTCSGIIIIIIIIFFFFGGGGEELEAYSRKYAKSSWVILVGYTTGLSPTSRQTFPVKLTLAG